MYRRLHQQGEPVARGADDLEPWNRDRAHRRGPIVRPETLQEACGRACGLRRAPDPLVSWGLVEVNPDCCFPCAPATTPVRQVAAI